MAIREWSGAACAHYQCMHSIRVLHCEVIRHRMLVDSHLQIAGKDKVMLFNIGGQTGKDCLYTLTCADGEKLLIRIGEQIRKRLLCFAGDPSQQELAPYPLDLFRLNPGRAFCDDYPRAQSHTRHQLFFFFGGGGGEQHYLCKLLQLGAVKLVL